MSYKHIEGPMNPFSYLQPLQSMPVSRREPNEDDLEDEEESDEDANQDAQQDAHHVNAGNWSRSSRPPSVKSGRSYRSTHTSSSWTRTSKNNSSPVSVTTSKYLTTF